MVVFYPSKYWSVYVLDAQATCDLVNEALNPYNEALTLEDMDILVP